MSEKRNQPKKDVKGNHLFDPLTSDDSLQNVSFAPGENSYLKESGEQDEEE